MADHDDDPGSRSDYSDATSAPPPLRALGRTYHHSGKILQPNDAAEADRYALQHELFRLALGGCGGGGAGGGDLTAVRLPRDRPVRILDVGTGSGQWAVEMGAAYPLAEVVGVDISPCLLPSAVPRNVSFQVEDVDCPDADEDRHRAGTLDLVHVRSIEVGGIADWVAFLRRAHAWLRPGGQIEVSSIWLGWADNPEAAMDLGRARERPDPLLQQSPPPPQQIDPERDGDDGAKGKSDLTKLMDLYAAAADRLAVHPQPQACVPRWLSEVGFERVVEVRDVVPAAGPGNDESSLAKAAILAELTAPIHFEAHSLRMLVLAGCEERRGREVIRRAALDSLVPDRAVYGAVKFITARKPDRPSG